MPASAKQSSLCSPSRMTSTTQTGSRWRMQSSPSWGKTEIYSQNACRASLLYLLMLNQLYLVIAKLRPKPDRAHSLGNIQSESPLVKSCNLQHQTLHNESCQMWGSRWPSCWAQAPCHHQVQPGHLISKYDYKHYTLISLLVAQLKWSASAYRLTCWGMLGPDHFVVSFKYIMYHSNT